MYNMYLNATNCDNLACLRAAPLDVLIKADQALTFDRGTTDGWIGPKIGWGPHPDGDLVPNAPDLLLAKVIYHRSVRKVLTANVANDGYAAIVSEYSRAEEQRVYGS
jgi:hypothetical protein